MIRTTDCECKTASINDHTPGACSGPVMHVGTDIVRKTTGFGSGI